MLSSGSNFASAFQIVFSPIGTDIDLERKFPNAIETIKNLGQYQMDMNALKEALQPEMDLIDSRVIVPIREFEGLCKKVRKAIVKRDHKLVDYDRFNNSYTKLRDKREKSLSDEKNLFKAEQEFEQATQEYEYHNNNLKNELPRFFEHATNFVTPLFQSFYYLQLQVLYTMLECVEGLVALVDAHRKSQAFASGRYELGANVEDTYHAQLGDAAEQLEALTITKRYVSTAKMLSQHRADTGSSPASSVAGGRPSGPSRTFSGSSSGSAAKPAAFRATPPSSHAAPPPYSAGSSGGGAAAAASGKRAPPPPPAARPVPQPKPSIIYCTALYDFEAQAAGDLSFSTGDRIEITKKTESTQDWWEGRVNGRSGAFPGN